MGIIFSMRIPHSILYLLCFFLASPLQAFAENDFTPLYPELEARELGNYDFTLLKRGSQNPQDVKVLVIGGIQGDEPGAFNTASLLSTHYTFENAQVHIIPNLNFLSILKRSRGVFGDMNRKFSSLSTKDKQYDEVRRLQNYITEFQPDIVLNLHDGSGFYSPKYVSSSRNPSKWGQAVIIDQAQMPSVLYGDLEEMGKRVTDLVNSRIRNKNDYFNVYNTKTPEGNVEMEKTLTWFCVKENIPAYGLEISKAFNTKNRVYYHLMQLEALFDLQGVKYSKNFTLTPDNVNKALYEDLYVKLADGRITLPIGGLKNTQAGYIPLPKKTSYTSLHPIVALHKEGNLVTVHYGNNRNTRFRTQVYSYSEANPVFKVVVDGKEKTLNMGEVLKVDKSFNISHIDGFRINAIGSMKEQKIGDIKTEANVTIAKKDFNTNYSLDHKNNLYRVEFYEGKSFVGMVVVDFS